MNTVTIELFTENNRTYADIRHVPNRTITDTIDNQIAMLRKGFTQFPFENYMLATYETYPISCVLARQTIYSTTVVIMYQEE